MKQKQSHRYREKQVVARGLGDGRNLEIGEGEVQTKKEKKERNEH